MHSVLHHPQPKKHFRLTFWHYKPTSEKPMPAVPSENLSSSRKCAEKVLKMGLAGCLTPYRWGQADVQVIL